MSDAALKERKAQVQPMVLGKFARFQEAQKGRATSLQGSMYHSRCGLCPLSQLQHCSHLGPDKSVLWRTLLYTVRCWETLWLLSARSQDHHHPSCVRLNCFYLWPKVLGKMEANRLLLRTTSLYKQLSLEMPRVEGPCCRSSSRELGGFSALCLLSQTIC